MQRRELLKSAALTTLAPAMRPLAIFAQAGAPSSTAPSFSTSNNTWQHAYDRALAVLEANVQVLPRYPSPVLIEGAEYAGIWQECGPHESLVYSLFRPDVARNTHMTFFALQREDGQLPANNKRSETGFGQFQMVVPIAATAWEPSTTTPGASPEFDGRMTSSTGTSALTAPRHTAASSEPLSITVPPSPSFATIPTPPSSECGTNPSPTSMAAPD